MTFDILDITQEEAENFETIQLKLLRTAQQKKNELYHKLKEELRVYNKLTMTNGTCHSSLYADKEAELVEEYEYQVEILREQLVFNMSLKEPTHNGETGNSGYDNTGYLVDYELSYIERYVLVRDYYMTIENPHERLALYAADTVAMDYLDTFYNSLYNYLAGFTKQK